TAIAGIGRPEALTALEAHAQALAAAVPEAGAGAGADPDRLRTRHLGLIIETMRVAEDIRRRNGLTP
ncbi:MAG: hypothetical protein RLZZ127_2949, partial [Planctomycetota bacterium]